MHRVSTGLRALVLVVALASILTFAGTAESTPAAAQGRTATAVTVKTGKSAYGKILFDGKGFALYAFTRDGRGRSRCSGACAAAWPPYIARGSIRPGTGISAKKLGVSRRADSRMQVTFEGRPLYYYVGDRQAGQVLCQNVNEFGGLWLVMRPNGSLVR